MATLGQVRGGGSCVRLVTLAGQRLYYKYPEDMPPLFLDLPQRLPALEGAIASPRAFQPDRSFDGAVYDADGTLAPESLRDERSIYRHAPAPSPPEPVREEPEEAIYLGSLMGHYGHFLLEMLPRFWAFGQARPAKVYVHPWRDRGATLAPFLRDTLNAVAGREIEVCVITEPTRFKRLLMPTSTFKLNVGASRAFADWCDAFTRARLAEAPPARSPRRIYCSRRGWARNRRGFPQEAQIEAWFAGLGFEIVRPEELSFFDQVRLFSGCEVLAGCGGSAMHNALFMPAGGRVVVLDFNVASNQHVVEAIKGHNAAHFRVLREAEPGLIRLNPKRFPEIYPEIERLLSLDDWLSPGPWG
jgi:hypothetical protein